MGQDYNTRKNLTFVKQTPKFLQKLQEEQQKIIVEDEKERETRKRNIEDDDEAPTIVNEEVAEKEEVEEYEKPVSNPVESPKTSILDEKSIKKAKQLQNVQKRNKNLLSFEDEE